MLFLLFSATPQAGGLKDISRWLTERGSAKMASPQAMARRAGHARVPALAGGHGHNEALRATPPDMDKKRMHPEGMPESHGAHLWHPSGMRFLSVIISGGVARKASLNHRLSSGKPPACFSATIQNSEEY
jgi:hypothetical protein